MISPETYKVWVAHEATRMADLIKLYQQLLHTLPLHEQLRYHVPLHIEEGAKHIFSELARLRAGQLPRYAMTRDGTKT